MANNPDSNQFLDKNTNESNLLILFFNPLVKLMPCRPRELKPDYYYHITTRCNNREISPGQMRLPWDEWEPLTTEVQAVAENLIVL
jgi:hypothetical protein